MLEVKVLPENQYDLPPITFGELQAGDVIYHYGMYLLVITEEMKDRVRCVRLTGKEDKSGDKYPAFSTGTWDGWHKVDGYLVERSELTIYER